MELELEFLNEDKVEAFSVEMGCSASKLDDPSKDCTTEIAAKKAKIDLVEAKKLAIVDLKRADATAAATACAQMTPPKVCTVFEQAKIDADYAKKSHTMETDILTKSEEFKTCKVANPSDFATKCKP